MAPIIFEAIMFLKYNRRLWALLALLRETSAARASVVAPRIATIFVKKLRPTWQMLRSGRANLDAVKEWEAMVLAE